MLPWIELLDTARAVAEFDLPMKVLGVLWWAVRDDAGRAALLTQLRQALGARATKLA